MRKWLVMIARSADSEPILSKKWTSDRSRNIATAREWTGASPHRSLVSTRDALEEAARFIEIVKVCGVLW